MASANTLTGLIPVIYRAIDKVAREQVGFLPACYKDSDVEEVAKDQQITYPIVGAQTASDATPAMTLPNPNGQTIGTGSMTISKVRKVDLPWSGEEQASLGRNYDTAYQGQLEQSFRTLTNEIEADLAVAAKEGASRAYGAAGTPPFGTAADFSDFAQPLKILKDNGAPDSDLHMVLNSTAAANIRGKQSSLFKANEAGGSELLRDAKLGRVEGFDLHESGQILSHVKGTGTSYVFNGAHAAGITSVVAKTGSGTIKAGDVVAFEDDTNKYVVNTGIAAPGTMKIGTPGLLQAQTDGKTITVGNDYRGNWAFHRDALHLLTRLPLMPPGGDAALDSIVVVDPYSGIAFRVSLYAGYLMNVISISVAWGVKASKSDFIVTLLG